MAPFRIVEIFDSIQGEGIFIGCPTTFIRLYGCNLRCRWCDTKYAFEEKPKTGILLDRLENYLKWQHVCITGGEPLVSPRLDRLIKAIPDYHFTSIETNGTLWPKEELLRWVDFWTVSPKLGSSGMEPKPKILKKFIDYLPEDCLQFKFVILDNRDLRETHQLIHHLGLNKTDIPIVLQPESSRFNTFPKKLTRMNAGFHRGDYLDELRNLTEKVLQSEDWQGLNVRVLPQLHKCLWGRIRGR